MADAIVNTAAVHEPLVASSHSIHAMWTQGIAWGLSHYLQIAIATAVGTILVAAMLGLRWLGKRLCRKPGNMTHWPATVGRVIARTSFWFIVLFAAKLVSGYADPPHLLARTIDVAFTIASALQVAVWVRELVLGVVEHRAGSDTHSGLGSAIGIIRLLVTVVLFAIAAVAILDNLGVNVTGLIAGLGVGGIAIGLAAKGIFDDLFSALSIIFDRPFQRGDAIRWDQSSGSVEQIGLKTTRVRSITGEEIIISNTNLLGKELHNMARLERRRIELVLGVAYYTPPDLCAGLPEMLRGIVEQQDKCTLVRCGMQGFGSSTLDFNLQFDVHSENYNEVFEARHKVCVAILAAFAEKGIDLPFPTQTQVTAGPDGRPVGDQAGPVQAFASGGGAALQAGNTEVAPD